MLEEYSENILMVRKMNSLQKKHGNTSMSPSFFLILFGSGFIYYMLF